MFQPQPASISFNENMVILFVTGIGTLWSPGGHTNRLVSAIPVLPTDFDTKLSTPQVNDTAANLLDSEIDDILVKPPEAEAKGNVKELLKTLANDTVNNLSELQVVDDAFEKATNSQSKDTIRILTDSLLEKKLNNSIYLITTYNIYGPITIQTNNTINPGPSNSKIILGPTSVQRGNSYGTTNPESSTDTINPENSTDTIKPENSTNTIKPENITDSIKPENSTDTIKPENSTDSIKPENSTDTIKPENSTDTIKSENSTNTIKPENITDTIKSENITDTIKPENITDSIKPENSTDTIKPENSTDTKKPEHSTDTKKSEDIYEVIYQKR